MRQQTIVERLDFVAKRIPGLKFTLPTMLVGEDHCIGCFMSCDMFYIEIKVDQSHQTVKDVIISHNISAEGISCPVLTKVLADQDFETFARHLIGLHSIYQIGTNDKIVKQRAYPALLAIETDLGILYDHQRRRTSNCHELVHKSPIGIMEMRKGGLPVRLTYFVTPHDLVDATNKILIDLTMNNIVEKNLGLSATVEIEGSRPHKLQVKPLISNQQNSSLPAYAPFNNQNSEKLPAQFILNLSQPLPILNSTIHQILSELNHEPSTIKEYLTNLITTSKESLISLIARSELDLNRGPFGRALDTLRIADNDSCDLTKHVYSIQLLDQSHTYHITDSYLERQGGVYLEKIPFTHPTSIPNILRILRQQALFNFVIGSCIRKNRNNNSNTVESVKILNDSNIFDVMPVTLTSLCVSFEHPSKESLASLEIDLKDLTCKLHALDKGSVCSNDFATKILQKSWSLPIALRSILRKCEERRLTLIEDASKRRERELQELLATTNTTTSILNGSSSSNSNNLINNSSNQHQSKPYLQYPDKSAKKVNDFPSMQKNINLSDLNQLVMTDNHNSTSGLAQNYAPNQPNPDSNNSESSDRSNFLKKYSCKPKAKQNVTAKSQTGSKILSLMLKRQNSSSSASDDASLKATLTKKAKVKTTQMIEAPVERPRFPATVSSAPISVVTGTKLMTSEEAAIAAAAVANATKQQQLIKQSKQQVSTNASINPTLSLSLMRSPSKQNPAIPPHNSSILINANSTNQLTGPLLAPSSVKIEPIMPTNPSATNPSGLRTTKLLPAPVPINHSNNVINSNCNNAAITKARKSSIGAVLDSLVGGVAPSEQASSSQSLTAQGNNSDGAKIGDSKGGPLVAKPKIRLPGSYNQFAIKHGSSGGLKLTVTKKPATNSIASSTSGSSSFAPSSCSPTTSASPATGPQVATNHPSSSATNTVSSSAKSNLNNLLNFGTSKPISRYTIPKISKTQQVTQSDSNQVSSTENLAAPTKLPPTRLPVAVNPSILSAPIIAPSLVPTPITIPVAVPGPYPGSVSAPVVAKAPVPVPMPTGSILATSNSTKPINGPIDVQVASNISASNQGVSSSSDNEAIKEPEPVISTPSSPVEFPTQADIVAPPPMIPIDSLYEQPASSEADPLPDDASDRLSIIDASDNLMDSTSNL